MRALFGAKRAGAGGGQGGYVHAFEAALLAVGAGSMTGVGVGGLEVLEIASDSGERRK